MALVFIYARLLGGGACGGGGKCHCGGGARCQQLSAVRVGHTHTYLLTYVRVCAGKRHERATNDGARLSAGEPLVILTCCMRAACMFST